MSGLWRRTAAGLTLWLMASVCMAGQRAASARAAGFRISGIVVDATTGAVVPGAELSTSGDVALKTVADGEGRFTFEGLEEGKYPLSASAPGFVKEGYNQHGAYFTGIAVGGGRDSEHVVFKLHRQAVIYGRVTDERGDGVRRATVFLFTEKVNNGKYGVTVAIQMETNDLGGYRFAHLMAGKYYVGVMARPWWAENGLKYQGRPEASRQGETFEVPQAQPAADPMFDVVYPMTYFAGATEDVGAAPLTAKAGDAIEANVQLTAVPAVHVLLTNLDAYKRRGQNVSVFAVEKPFGAMPMTVNSANATEIGGGVYEVGGLPPGEVRLTVNRGGDAEWDAHSIRLNAVEGESVDAAAKAATSTVSGIVVAAEGSKAGIEGEVVLRSGDEESASARLGKDGTFRIPSVEEGTYEVLVNSRTGGDYVAKVSATGAKVNGRTVKIEGASEVRLNLALGRGLGKVEGAVQRDGKPAAGMMVLMVPDAPGLSLGETEQLTRMDESDSDGTFSLGGVVPGRYVLMAIEDGWELEWKDGAVLAAYREKGVRVEVAAGEEKKVAVEGVKKVAVESR